MLKRAPRKHFMLIALLFIATAFVACKKEMSVNRSDEKYTSLQDFYEKNAVPMQHFSVTVENGATFATTAGTQIIVPPNAFIDESGNAVTGKVDIEYKEIYKKSDMLLSNMPASTYGRPLKSGGEFFIRAKAGDKFVNLAYRKRIEIAQPFSATGDADENMKPFVADIEDGVANWRAPVIDSSNVDSITLNATSYVFSMYSFKQPLANGTWANSDDEHFFDGYPQTKLTIINNNATDTGFHYVDVFLVFTEVNSMVHVYSTGPGEYRYDYAPAGLRCTVVTVALKNEQLYSTFVPLTITNNNTVSFSLMPTSLDVFKARLGGLNN